MATLTDAETGSMVYNLIESIPTNLSGTTLVFLVDQSVYTANNYTGNNISVNAIPEAYQPAIVNLTISQVLGQMEAQGLGTRSVQIGELSLTKGMQEGTSNSYKQLAYNQLNDLGHKTSYYQTFR